MKNCSYQQFFTFEIRLIIMIAYKKNPWHITNDQIKKNKKIRWINTIMNKIKSLKKLLYYNIGCKNNYK